MRLTQSAFSEVLGISRPHLAKLELEPDKPISPRLCKAIDELLARSHEGIRQIKVLSWAQAGAGVDFEELPLDWQRSVPTACPDKDAFALELRGDSMEPKYSTGDILVLMPGNEPRTGSLVVARLEEGDVMFKLYNPNTPSPSEVTLTSLNLAYPPIIISKQSLRWVYPVYQVIRETWEEHRA